MKLARGPLVVVASALSFSALFSGTARADAPGAAKPSPPSASPPGDVAQTAPPPAAPVTTSPAPSPLTATPPAEAPPPVSTAALPPEARPIIGIGKRYTTWDLNVDGAFGRVFSDPAAWSGFGRVRAGVLWVRDPTFLSIGLTYELSTLSPATLGVQGEWMNLEAGIWFQAGPLLDVDHGGRLGVMGAVGWSIFGVEVQGRDVAGSGVVPAAYLKLRIPISIIAFGLRGR